MTVDLDDEADGDFLTGLSSLRRYDVSQSRARQLRRRCHAVLQTEPRTQESVRMMDRALFRRVVVPALGAAWCLAYVAEIIRYTAAIYTYFGTQ
jgi:hypothetical protein